MSMTVIAWLFIGAGIALIALAVILWKVVLE